MRPLWRLVRRGGELELHRGNSTVPYQTWEATDANLALGNAVVLVLNIILIEGAR